LTTIVSGRQLNCTNSSAAAWVEGGKDGVGGSSVRKEDGWILGRKTVLVGLLNFVDASVTAVVVVVVLDSAIAMTSMELVWVSEIPDIEEDVIVNGGDSGDMSSVSGDGIRNNIHRWRKVL
jgi:hypothetical protein